MGYHEKRVGLVKTIAVQYKQQLSHHACLQPTKCSLNTKMVGQDFDWVRLPVLGLSWKVFLHCLSWNGQLG
jgi:hypothetical protein